MSLDSLSFIEKYWPIALDQIADYFRAGWDVTVFGDGPGHIAPMPAAIGGDPSTWPKLTKFAAYKAGLVRILMAKAHYSLLPHSVLEYVKNSQIGISGFVFDSGDASGLTSGIPALDPALLIQLPRGTDDGIVKVFTDLGRPGRPGTTEQHSFVETAYHEMTHAWMIDSRDEDSAMNDLFEDGLKAFAGATGSAGTQLDPERAFLEAAASYVGARVRAWCMALARQNVALFAKDDSGDPEAFRQRLLDYTAQTVIDYNAALDVQTYGFVKGEHIASPPIPAALRRKLDAKLLDNRLLVSRFEETALGSILAGS
jgi:hypothetical protein